MPDIELLKIEKRGGEELRLCLSEYRGTSFLNLRTFIENTDGVMIPTKKGVTIPLWAAPDLRDALGAVHRRIYGPHFATVTSLCARQARGEIEDTPRPDPFEGEVIDNEPDHAG